MPFTAEIIENERFGNDIHILKLTFPDLGNFSHEPGQFAILAPNGIGRAYSIANYPSNKYLEFCIRKVPNGRVSPYLCSMEPGDKIVLEAPFGDFVLNHKTNNNLIFICSGTGIAPIKAMLEFLSTKKFLKEKEIILIHGWRENKHPYSDFLSFLIKNNVKIFVTEDVEKILYSLKSFKNFEAYVCGSPDFVKKVMRICKQKGIEKVNYEKCIFSDLKISGKPLSLLP